MRIIDYGGTIQLSDNKSQDYGYLTIPSMVPSNDDYAYLSYTVQYKDTFIYLVSKSHWERSGAPSTIWIKFVKNWP